MRFKNMIYLFSLLLFSVPVIGQNNCYKDYRCFHTQYKNEDVSILVKSKMGEEEIEKPLIYYIQGSLPRPLIINYPDEDFKNDIAFSVSGGKNSSRLSFGSGVQTVYSRNGQYN